MPENPLAPMLKLDPVFMKHVQSTTELIYAEGAVPKKYKLLIAMAFDAAHGADAGVRHLASEAMAAGATKQEIAEVLRVAFELTGVGTLYVAARGLKDLVG